MKILIRRDLDHLRKRKKLGSMTTATTQNKFKYSEARILVVDDEPGNVKILERLLRGSGFKNITSTTDGLTSLELYKTYQPDIVLLDIKMPNFSGFDVMDALSSENQHDYLPILVLTAQMDHSTRLKALKAGAKDFIQKPFDMAEILARIQNILEVRLLHNAVRDHNKTLEEEVQARTQELEKSRMDVIHRLGRAAEYRDNETGMHVIRMSKYCERLAREIGLDDKTSRLLLYASPMHDVGKIGIPDRILLKPGKLNAEEWKIMKTHAEIGAKILSGSSSGLMQMGETIARCHHEHWDGSGYPQGLKGREIPVEARIVTVCDVFDALTSERPYKEAWSVADTVAEMKRLKGTLFDPELLEMFLQILPEIIIISKRFSDTETDPTILESIREEIFPESFAQSNSL